jgi:hypothetical protein
MGSIKGTYFSKTMGATATLTSAYDLGRTWRNVSVEIPSMASASDFYIQASVTESGTFRRITHPVPNTSSVQLNDFRISSAVTARIVPIPADYQYIKIEASTMNTAALVFNVICKD